MSHAIALNQMVVWMFAGVLAYAAWTDWRSYTIPNSLCLALLFLYPVFVLTADHPVAVGPAVAVGLLTFACGAVLFALGGIGGGDVKLLAVVALWAGPAQFFDVLLVTTLAGGVLAIAYWSHRRLTAPAGARAPIGRSLKQWVMAPLVDWFWVAASRMPAAPLPAAGSGGGAAQQPQYLPYGIAIFVGGLYLVSLMLGR